MQPVCLCVLLAAAVLVSAAPSQHELEDQLSDSLETRVRLPRATCDLLSFQIKGIALNHSACAAHCLTLRRGFRGGRCKDGICHCRK